MKKTCLLFIGIISFGLIGCSVLSFDEAKSDSELTEKEGFRVTLNCHNTVKKFGDPLYLVDGNITPAEDLNLSPDSIASIEVLKDSASTNMYGPKAKYGVVLITTKK